MSTVQLLYSQGPMTKKSPATNKALVEECVKHPREYHNPREDITRQRLTIDGGQEGIASIITMLDTMDRRIIMMGKSIHALQVRCDICSGPHLKKDCDLDENGYKKSQVCYSSRDRYDEDWRNPRWKPHNEYKKEKEEK